MEISSKLNNKNKIKGDINKTNKDSYKDNNMKKNSQSLKINSNTKNKIPTKNVGNGNGNRKEILIYKILKRWWYAIGEWPPKDFNPQ
jgi:hypothetical protein